MRDLERHLQHLQAGRQTLQFLLLPDYLQVEHEVLEESSEDRFHYTNQSIPERINHHTNLELIWHILPSCCCCLFTLNEAAALSVRGTD
jgi:hypothetical protein